MSGGPVGRRLSELVSTVRRHRGLLTITLVLLAVDLAFIGLYAVTRGMRATDLDPGFFGRTELRITTEGSVPEFFNYAKTLLVALVSLHLARVFRQPVYLALALLYGTILLDDSLAIHETLGERLVDAWGLGTLLGVKAQDQGELLAWALLGAILLPILAWGLRRSDRDHVITGAVLLVPVAALLLFGIGVDMLYGLGKDAFPGAGLLLDTVEDGGEMVATTAACALTLAVVYRRAAGSRQGV